MRFAAYLCCAALTSAVGPAAELQFNRDVRPILSDKCLHCHGTDAVAKKIQLRLDQESTAKADLGGGRRALVEGHPEQSELIRRITAPKPAIRMPPVYSGLKLSDKEIETLQHWIEQGAKWEKHWAFVPPVAAHVPVGENGIDYFVRARLQREGLRPSLEADRTTLIRRVSFDVTGLPPTPEEVDAFVNDRSSRAWEKVVDRLLTSPHYGERMAARWLDAARYADTNGYQTDAERVMWPWRDWVIDAFNQNKPYDTFAVEQIAGDLLQNATLDQKIATGFNRNHRGNSEGGIVPEEYLLEYAVDRVETTSTVFLGLTMGCARCHNHKYDPVTQREFYQMLAYFNNVPELGRYLKFGNTPPYVTAPTAQQQSKISRLQAEVEQAQDSFRAALRKAERQRLGWERSLSKAADWHVQDHLQAQLTPPHEGPVGDYGDYGFFDRFSVTAKFLPQTPTMPIVTRAEQKEGGEGWSIVLEDGKLQVNLIKRKLDDSIRVETEQPISLNVPHHVGITYDGSRLAAGVRVYVDGKPAPLKTILDAINQDFRSKEPLRAGKSVGDIRIYGDVLTAAEMASEALPRTLGEIAHVSEKDRTEAESAKLQRAFQEIGPDEQLKAAWTTLRTRRASFDAYLRDVPTVMVMAEAPVRKETFILDRGAYDRPREKVGRGVPAALHPLPQQAPDNRLGLAKWIVDPANPLTARVAVNRFWQMYFGTGIVKTTEDFGSQGEWPANPELLDWMATEFVRSGWDIKGLQKQIVMSATYRQSSVTSADLLARDPENRLLARGPRVRLPAEMIRDQALAASGLLVTKIGGPSAKPYQPSGLWSELGDKDYERDHGEGLYRRSIYTYWKRTSAPPFMGTFDSALREACAVRESRTNTPLQALNIMNDVTFVEASRVLAQRAMLATLDSDARIQYAFRRILSRAPRPTETARLRSSLQYFLDRFQTNPIGAEELLKMGDAPAASSLKKAELAAYTAVVSLLFNLDEAITKE